MKEECGISNRTEPSAPLCMSTKERAVTVFIHLQIPTTNPVRLLPSRKG
jgi:hypothetical protein